MRYIEENLKKDNILALIAGSWDVGGGIKIHYEIDYEQSLPAGTTLAFLYNQVRLHMNAIKDEAYLDIDYTSENDEMPIKCKNSAPLQHFTSDCKFNGKFQQSYSSYYQFRNMLNQNYRKINASSGCFFIQNIVNVKESEKKYFPRKILDDENSNCGNSAKEKYVEELNLENLIMDSELKETGLLHGKLKVKIEFNEQIVSHGELEVDKIKERLDNIEILKLRCEGEYDRIGGMTMKIDLKNVDTPMVGYVRECFSSCRNEQLIEIKKENIISFTAQSDKSEIYLILKKKNGVTIDTWINKTKEKIKDC